LTAKLRSAANGSPARGRGAGAAAQIAAGYDVELLEGPERVAAREPALAGGSVIGAVHAPRSAHVEPMEAAVAIADAAVSLGGARLLEDARVTAIRALPAGDGGGGERGTVGPSILQLSVATLRRRESFLRV
jgi:glycine/D-amino acid oxidase-like deaminating enzyme